MVHVARRDHLGTSIYKEGGAALITARAPDGTYSVGYSDSRRREAALSGDLLTPLTLTLTDGPRTKRVARDQATAQLELENAQLQSELKKLRADNAAHAWEADQAHAAKNAALNAEAAARNTAVVAESAAAAAQREHQATAAALYHAQRVVPDLIDAAAAKAGAVEREEQEGNRRKERTAAFPTRRGKRVWSS